MFPRRFYGPISLSLAAGGYVGITLLRAHGVLVGEVGELLSATCEAGTIGGVADWFAVSALFHHIPIPVIGRHTDIIARNRSRITDKIVDIVESEWLAPEVVGAKLGELLHSGSLLAWLDAPEHRQQTRSLMCHVIDLGVRQLNSPEAAAAVSLLLKDQLHQWDASAALGRWLQSTISLREHDPIWTGALRAFSEQLDVPRTRQVLRSLLQESVISVGPALLRHAVQGRNAEKVQGAVKSLIMSLDLARLLGSWLKHAVSVAAHAPMSVALIQALRAELDTSPVFANLIHGVVEDAISRWKHRGWRQRMLGGGAELFGALRKDVIARDVTLAIDAALDAASHDSRHPIRRQLDGTLSEFASRLAGGDTELSIPLTRMIGEFVERADLRSLLPMIAERFAADLNADNSLLDWDGLVDAVIPVVRRLLSEAADQNHPLHRMFDTHVNDFAERLVGGDANARATVTSWHHRLIEGVDATSAIRGSLTRLATNLHGQLSQPDGPMVRWCDLMLDGALNTLRADPERRRSVDQWLRRTVTELVHAHHELIGQMVRASLGALSDRALVDQIEAKVGDDLQYIRLNGAVVGGAVGLLLTLFRLHV